MNVSSPQESRSRIGATAKACLDAVESGSMTAELADQIAVRVAHADLVFTADAVKVLEEISNLAERAATACERISDLATPTSDVHRWTDELDLCRQAVPALRAKLAGPYTE